MKKQTTFYAASRSLLREAAIRPLLRTRFLLLFLLGICLLPSLSRAQTFPWATRTTNTYAKTAVSADNAGNTYVTASFTGTLTVGAYTFTSRGGEDICLVKYNPAGVVQWARRIGSTGDDSSGDVTVTQSSGKVFITGSFKSTVQFGSYHGYDVSPLTSAGGSDVFVARYTASTGTLDWARRAGGTTEDLGSGIYTDDSDNVYVTGSFTGTAYFNTGVLPYSLLSSGNSDIFAAKYNAAGSLQFARRLGGAGFDSGAAIAVDKYNGEIYLTGGYSPATHLYISNVFVAKYNAAGTLLWNQVAGTGSYLDAGNDIIVTASGAYVTGYFGNSITFGSTTLNSSGSSDVFVVHFSYVGSGNVIWAKRYGGANWDEGQSIAQYIGDLYIGGTFNGTATFGHTTVTATGGAGDRDMFVSRLFSDGTPSWTGRIGSTGYDYGRGGLAVPTYNTIYFTGHRGNTITLGATTLSGSGNMLAKITPPTLPSVTEFRLINAVTNADLGTIVGFSEINYLLIGTNQINIRANTSPGTVGSVKFDLDGVVRTENAAPYAYAGDTGGGTDYLPFTPSLGGHRLEATAYSGPNGTGAKGVTRILFFTVVNKPVVSSITLINAATDVTAGTLTSGQTINYSTLGTNQISFRANTNPATVGSVKFDLDGTIRIENAAPYAYAGDTGGGTNYNAITPAAGYHRLIVTPYTGANATGTAGTPYDIYFYINTGSGRIAAAGPEPETQSAVFTVAPNPFAQRTSIAFTPTADGPVKLEVYSTNGILVKRIFEGTLESGKPYEWEFDGTALPGGVYIGRITAGRQVFHSKLVLNK